MTANWQRAQHRCQSSFLQSDILGVICARVCQCHIGKKKGKQSQWTNQKGQWHSCQRGRKGYADWHPSGVWSTATLIRQRTVAMLSTHSLLSVCAVSCCWSVPSPLPPSSSSSLGGMFVCLDGEERRRRRWSWWHGERGRDQQLGGSGSTAKLLATWRARPGPPTCATCEQSAFQLHVVACAVDNWWCITRLIN